MDLSLIVQAGHWDDSVWEITEHFNLNLIKERDPGTAPNRRASGRHINNLFNVISTSFPRLPMTF